MADAVYTYDFVRATDLSVHKGLSPVNGGIHLGWPNRITIGRILLIGPFVVCLINQTNQGYEYLRWVAIGIFAAMAVSDMLDGWLARRLHQESDLGRFLDPLADKLLITSAVIILAFKGIRAESPTGETRLLELPNWVAVAAIGKDVVVSLGFAIIWGMTGKGSIQPRFLGKACTTVQLVLVLSMLLWPSLPNWLSRLPEVLYWLAAAFAIAATLDYIRIGGRFLSTSNKNHKSDSGE